MSRSKLVYLSVIFAGLAFGQLDSNSVTVTASRNTTVPPDQAVFSVVVTSDLNSTLNDVLTAVLPAGISITNFSGVSSNSLMFISGPNSQTQQTLQWAFQLLAPLTNTKSTVTTLASLQTSVPKANKNLSVSFTVQGTQTSQQAQQAQTCDVAGLINDARAKAQTLAAAGGRTVGGLLAMSSSTSGVAGPASGAIIGVLAVAPPVLPQPCVVTVKFALLGS
jgi:uncharacterized protein YggE